ncbi:MAG TPA: methyltransferase domain-containing protein, partial [Mariniphaga sp.]|nr:methyltransferase domain-containing protein [Mariniphaga sp.]
NLGFPENSFDFVILHLILTVIPDPVACIQEAERVLKKGGQTIIYDKFIRNHKKVSLFRSVINIFTSFFFSDITKDAHSIIDTTGLIIQSDLEADFNGNFRLIKLIKE